MDTHELLERARRTHEEARRVSAEHERITRVSREIRHWTTRVQGRVSGKAGPVLSFHARSNRLLGMLPPTEFERLVPFFEGVRFKSHQILHHANSTIDYVYFPINGLLSAAIVLRDGGSMEVAAIGNEGMVGLAACLRNGRSPYHVAVQVPGESLRIDVQVLRDSFSKVGTLRDILSEYQGLLEIQSAYQVACSGLHHADQRCCRRLLTTQDVIHSNVLPITHETLANSLGVRRATITEGLGQLQSTGVVECARGRITILDRSQLQTRSCECYQALSEEFSHFFSNAG